jgi:entericidin B
MILQQMADPVSSKRHFFHARWHAVCSIGARVVRITPIQHIEGTSMFKKIMICFAALAVVSLTACNTVQGAGKDIERGGEKVQDASKDVQKKM